MRFARKASRRLSLADSILPLYETGKGHKTIAKELGISPRITRTVLIEQGVWNPQRPGKKDPNAPYSRLRAKKFTISPFLGLLRRNSILISDTAKRWVRHAKKVSSEHRKSCPVHREAMRKKDADRMRFLYQNNTEHRLIQLLRKRLTKVAQRGRGYGGNNLAWLGCTPVQLRAHIEQQFKKGMTWDNLGVGRGMWNIDHIIPCKAFDMTQEAHRKRCFHYTNLRPMWSIRNIRKGAKRKPAEQMGLI